MKKIMITLFAALALTTFFTGCGQSTPLGTDQAVKDTVLEIATGELRNQLAPVIYQKVTGIPVNAIGVKITYADLKAKATKDVHAQKAVTAIDTAVAKTKLSLSNIRTNEVNDKTKMSRSSADLFVNKFKVPIEYTAQLNAEGQVYVEVSGLRF